ncbi:exo-alpha-sialidase [Stieleria sp. TO1_6]|uniref:sialidase family protein n=1 Tax=Stieleria tagensis TaxID=2956795 RepID=UPI00209BA342|nr:sialidase family protein [Stieleria tagensis]MCO8120628.1 exo-alpha-sialidase [Stieleria tagensis]
MYRRLISRLSFVGGMLMLLGPWAGFTSAVVDDVALTAQTRQQITAIESIPLTLPVMVGSAASPIVKMEITATGSQKPLSITKVTASIVGEGAETEFHSVQLFCSGSDSTFRNATQFGESQATGTGKLHAFNGKQQLAEGQNYIWLAGQLKENVDIDRMVAAEIDSITFSNGEIKSFAVDPSVQRLAVSVRDAGDDGVHTYRIPGLATTNQGTLIAVYDVRRRSGGDLPGDIDVGMSRSIDGGRTWQPMKIIMDMGDDPDWRYDGVGDPAVLVDRNTGTLWVAGTWSHGNRSWHGSGPGLTPDQTGQLMLVRSDDDGVTWSEPINITHQVKRPEWCFLLQGPGKGITLHDGTLVFAAQYQDPPNPDDAKAHRLPHSTIIYSKDHGNTWHVGAGAFDDTTESQVIEIEPGVLMLNCRYNRGSVRVVMTTDDLGKTWRQHSTSQRSLIEPGSCMASLIDVDREVGADVGNWLLFSNPDSTRGRHHLTIKASPDRGLTWPDSHRLLLDEGASAGYSCMSMIDNKTVGILYEGSRSQLTFQRIAISDLVSEQSPSP